METKSTRQKRHQNTKQAILEAALDLIAEKGIERFSLREVARRVEYSPAGLYEYFGSKEEILKALAREGERRLSILMQAVPSTSAVDEYLVGLCLSYIEFALTNVEYFILMSSHVSERRSLGEPIPTESAYNILVQGIQLAIDNRLISIEGEYGVEEITYSIWALVHGMATLKISHLKDFQADFDTINRIALKKFIKGLK